MLLFRNRLSYYSVLYFLLYCAQVESAVTESDQEDELDRILRNADFSQLLRSPLQPLPRQQMIPEKARKSRKKRGRKRKSKKGKKGKKVPVTTKLHSGKLQKSSPSQPLPREQMIPEKAHKIQKTRGKNGKSKSKKGENGKEDPVTTKLQSGKLPLANTSRKVRFDLWR